MEEQWKLIHINGRRVHYAVSNMGRVKNVKSGRILIPTVTGRTKYVSIYTDKTVHRVKICDLVANEFVPNPDPINRKFVNYMDGNPENVKVDNLKWSRFKTTQTRSSIDSKDSRCTMSENFLKKQVLLACEYLDDGLLSIEEVSEQTKLPVELLNMIINREKYVAISQKFSFKKIIREA